MSKFSSEDEDPHYHQKEEPFPVIRRVENVYGLEELHKIRVRFKNTMYCIIDFQRQYLKDMAGKPLTKTFGEIFDDNTMLLGLLLQNLMDLERSFKEEVALNTELMKDSHDRFLKILQQQEKRTYDERLVVGNHNPPSSFSDMENTPNVRKFLL